MFRFKVISKSTSQLLKQPQVLCILIILFLLLGTALYYLLALSISIKFIAILLALIVALVVSFFGFPLIHAAHFKRTLQPGAHRSLNIKSSEVRISLLFSDIENFASIVHELTPSQLDAFMKEYLGLMTDLLIERGGLLDKYVGDAIIGMYGVTDLKANHAAGACRTAMAMQVECARLRLKWQSEGSWPASVCCLRTRVGINTGNATVGNFGSHVRTNYTMLGDSVNVGARCEQIAKEYGVYIVVTEASLREALKTMPDLLYRKLDIVNFKGRYDRLSLYELWSTEEDLKLARLCKERYEAAFEAYLQKDFVTALKGFQSAKEFEPHASIHTHSPSEVLAKRTQSYLEQGAPAGWTGAFHARL